MSAKITMNVDEVLKDLDDFKKVVRKSAERGAEKGLKKSLTKLKLDLNLLVAQQATTTTTSGKTEETSTVDVPKTKAEAIAAIFGENVKDIQNYQKTTLKEVQMNDNSNVFVMKDLRVKAYQSINQGSTLENELLRFRKRLESGIIIDSDSGRIYKLDKNVLAGIKVECSTDRGITLNSENKFKNYAEGDKVTRRKDGTRVAVWTIKQENLKSAIDNALDVDAVVEDILQEKYQDAIDKLKSVNENQFANEIANIGKISKKIPTEVKAVQEIKRLIANLKIEKQVVNNETIYILVTFYSEQEGTINFLDEVTQKVDLWLLTEQDGWFREMIKQVTQAVISFYDKQVGKDGQ